jgi:dihydropteroate synthase
MDGQDHYDNVAQDVTAELSQRVESLSETGISTSRIVLDPGLGFAKRGDSNWKMLAGLSELSALGLPILIGASRKRFIGDIIDADRRMLESTTGYISNNSDSSPRFKRHDDATAAISALCAFHKVWAVRVHEPQASRTSVLVADAWDQFLNDNRTDI